MAKPAIQESFIKLVFSQISNYQGKGYKNTSKFESITDSLFELLPVNTPLYLKEIENLLTQYEKDNSLNALSISKIKTKLKKSWYDYWVGQKNIAKNEQKYLNEYYTKFSLPQQQKLLGFASNIKIDPTLVKERPQSYYILQDIKNSDYKSLNAYIASDSKIDIKFGLSIIKTLNQNQAKKITFTSSDFLSLIMKVIEKSSMPTSKLRQIWFENDFIDFMMASSPDIFKKNFDILTKNNIDYRKDSSWGKEMTANFFTNSDSVELQGNTKKYLNTLIVYSLISPLCRFEINATPNSVATLQEFDNFWKNFHFLTLLPNQKYKKLFKANFGFDINEKTDLIISLSPHWNLKNIQKEILGSVEDDLGEIISPLASSYPKIYTEQKMLSSTLSAKKKTVGAVQKI